MVLATVVADRMLNATSWFIDVVEGGGCGW
jgi:hypothetical protein